MTLRTNKKTGVSCLDEIMQIPVCAFINNWPKASPLRTMGCRYIVYTLFYNMNEAFISTGLKYVTVKS
jgi:hypothetical protein